MNKKNATIIMAKNHFKPFRLSKKRLGEKYERTARQYAPTPRITSKSKRYLFFTVFVDRIITTFACLSFTFTAGVFGCRKNRKHFSNFHHAPFFIIPHKNFFSSVFRKNAKTNSRNTQYAAHCLSKVRARRAGIAFVGSNQACRLL